jgi:hypothetical protein
MPDNQNLDERLNLPSASGIERIALCPGSWHAEKNLSPTTSDEAASGTRIHAAYEGQDVGLREGEDWVLAELIQHTEELCQRLGFVGDETREIRESRLWYEATEGRPIPERIFSGKADRIYVSGRRALIIDAKTGYSGAEEASRNWQLRALAVLLKQNVDVDEVYVAIIQPRVEPSVSVACYDRAALQQAETSILQVIENAMRPDAPRIPGSPQCDYCRANSACQARVSHALLATTSLPAHPNALTPEQIAQWLPKIAFAEKVFRDIKKLAIDSIAVASGVPQNERGEWDWTGFDFDSQPSVIPGYRLKKGGKIKHVDAGIVWANIDRLGFLEPEEFVRCCEVSQGKLKEMLAQRHGIKGKELAQALEDCLIGAFTETQKSPSLEAE